MQRRLMIAGALSVLSITVLFVIISTVPALIETDQTLSFKSGANSTVKMQIAGYNNGTLVNVPFIKNSPFLVEGVDIDEIRIVMNWTSTGKNVKWNTFGMTGSVKVDQLNKYDTWIVKYTTSFSSTISNSSKVFSLILGTDICKFADVLDGGWFLQFTVSASASVTDDIGGVLTRTANPLTGTKNIVYSSAFGFGTTW